MASALQHFLMGARGGKGQPGRPYMAGSNYSSGPLMNLSPDQFAAAHTLSAALAAQGPKMASHVKHQLDDAQQQRRQIRSQEAVAAGLPADVSFYGPHADPRAVALLHGGSGIGAGLGAARAAPHPAHGLQQVDPANLAGLLRALGRTRRRRGGFGGSGGSG
jgi:hypothetical protein